MPQPKRIAEKSEKSEKTVETDIRRLAKKQLGVGVRARGRKERVNIRMARRSVVLNFASKSASKKKVSASRGRGQDGDGSIKKPRRFRPGTVAMREIIDLQSGRHNTTQLIRKAPMYWVIREAMQSVRSEYRLTASAVAALHQATEDEMVKQFEVAQVLAIHANRETIQPKDLVAGNRVRSIHPAKAHMPYDPTQIYKFRGDGPKKRMTMKSGAVKKLDTKVVKKSSHTMKQRHQPHWTVYNEVENKTKNDDKKKDDAHSVVVCDNENSSNAVIDDKTGNEKDTQTNSDEIDISLSLSSLSDDDDEEEEEEEDDDDDHDENESGGVMEIESTKNSIITKSNENVGTADNDEDGDDEI